MSHTRLYLTAILIPLSYIARILGSRPGVLNLHLETDISGLSEDRPRMTMLYKVKSGSIQEKNYGINLARVMGFPDSFIETAQGVSQTLTESRERRRDASDSRRLIRQRKVILNLHLMLTQLVQSKMDDAAMGSYLRHLQDEFVLQMDSSNAGEGGEEMN